MDVYQAVPADPAACGLPHYYVMHLMDQLAERFKEQPLRALKGQLDRRHLLHDVILERVETGRRRHGCG